MILVIIYPNDLSVDLGGEIFLPAGVSFEIFVAVSDVGFDDLDFLKRSECLGVVAVDTGSNAGTLCGAYRSVGIVELDSGARYSGQCLAEDGAEEHIGVSGVNLGDVHAE